MTAAAVPAVVVAERRAASHLAILGVLSLAAFMASLDMFIVNVAFPDIAREFRGESLGNLSWILNGYTVLYAALLVPLGRLADRYGRLTGFLAGLALFTIASAACAASGNLWSLVTFRGLQAVGAAALTPTSLGLLLAATPSEGRVKAVRMWAAIGALAAAVGPVIGGLLVQASWRWIFIVNLPVGVLAWVAARRIVPDSRDLAVARIPDLGGAALAIAGIGALALALVKGPDWGWSSSGVDAGLGVAVVATVWFWIRSQRHPLPVVEPALLRVRAFAWSNLTSVLFSAAFAAGLIAIVLWLQQVWHYSALRTGVALLPGPLMVPVFTALAQRWSRRLPVGMLAALGCALFGAGVLLTSLRIGIDTSYAATLLPYWMIGGAGVGLAFPTIMSAATADLPPARSATGSAVINMARQIGFVLGVSAFVAVLGAPRGESATLHAFQHAWWAITAVAAVGAMTAIGMTPKRTAEGLVTQT